MMNTCKNCRWWGKNLRVERSRGDKGVCDLEGGMADSASSFHVDADAADDTGLTANLVTGPDFGCNQFEPKDQPKQN